MFNLKSISSTLGFQLVWWGLLVFASQGKQLEACLVGALYVCFHCFVTAKERSIKELQFIVIFGGLGWLVDSLLIHISILDFSGSFLAPPWVLFMWMNYMTSIHYSMAITFRSLPLTLFIGFIFGPWTYLACYKLNLVSFPFKLWLSAILQGFIWMAWIYIYRWVCLKKIF